jgi:hypothetical protein
MKENILLYSQLSPTEQADIESYVAQHPDLYPLLEEAKALGDVFKEAQRAHADPPDDEVLAYYLVTRQMNQHPTPPGLHAVFSRIEARLQTDDDLRARYDRLAQRVTDLEASSDTVAHFERVTGHRLQPPSKSQPGFSPDTPVDRGPVRRSGRLMRRVGGAIGGVLAVFLVLFVVSTLTISPLDDLAAFETDDLIGMGVTRGGNPTAGLTNEQRYEQALVLLRDVRTATFGLFPRYDANRLQTAGSLLADIADQPGEETMLQLEAAYLLAKVRLAQHDVPAARAALAQVTGSDNGWRKAEAEALLEAIPDQD